MIKKRHVLFVHGFDARGAKHYYRLFSQEGRKHAARNHTPLAFSPAAPTSDGDQRWSIDRAGPASPVRTTFDYMVWDDIVRAQVRLGLLRTYGKAIANFVTLQRLGWFGSILRADRSMGALCLYPYVMCLLYLLAAAALAVGAGSLAAAAGLTMGPAAGAGLLAFLAMTRLVKRADRVMYVLYLTRVFSFILAQSRGETPEMEARLDRFAATIHAAATKAGTDEVLLVGHSAGSFEAVAALARALETMPAGARISFLTLGQAIPLLSALPGADRFRQDLRQVARAPQVQWVDISSPMDNICVALHDPIPRQGGAAAPAEGASPKILSARLRRSFSERSLARLRYRIFDMHFVYFLANDLPGCWNWVDVCTGPQSLSERFADRESRPRAA